MENFLFGFRNFETRIAFRAGNNKCMMENIVYFPFGNVTPLDMINPITFCKVVTGTETGKRTSDELTFGLYMKSSLDYIERTRRLQHIDIR